MSGGAFEYNQYRIELIIDTIQEELDNQGKEKELEYYQSTDYFEKYPEEKLHYTYPEDIQQIFKDGIKALKIAHIYAQRIDWYLSGDDGEDSLRERLKKELKEI